MEGCEQKCECQEGGLLQCYNTSCRPGTESCQLHDGQYECRPLGKLKTVKLTHIHHAMKYECRLWTCTCGDIDLRSP